jgi:hypothetical protein
MGIEPQPADLDNGTLQGVLSLTDTASKSDRGSIYGKLRGRDWQNLVRRGKLRSGKYTTCALQKKLGALLKA